MNILSFIKKKQQIKITEHWSALIDFASLRQNVTTFSVPLRASIDNSVYLNKDVVIWRVVK